jgi:hypothetical protein
VKKKLATTVVWKKLSKGLYISHEHGMTLSHEVVWSRYPGRKWELTFKLQYGMLTPTKHTKKFDTVKEARAYANALLNGAG